MPSEDVEAAPTQPQSASAVCPEGAEDAGVSTAKGKKSGNILSNFLHKAKARFVRKKEDKMQLEYDPEGVELAANEHPDVVAELGWHTAASCVVRENKVVKMTNGRCYRLLDSADMDFGQVPIQLLRRRPDGADNDTFDADFKTLFYETNTAECKRIRYQAMVMALAASSNCHHFLRIQSLGSTHAFKFLVTEEHGASLQDLLFANVSFAPGSALKLALQTVEALEELHALGFVCRDVKPRVFVLHRTDTARILLAHLGLVRRFRKGDFIVPPRHRVPFFGAKRYAPRTAHAETERHRGSDLESWCFMVAEFFHHKVLPWRNLTRLQEIARLKTDFFTERGLAGVRERAPKVPERLFKILTYVDKLEYAEVPDYPNIRFMLHEMIEEGGWIDAPFEWEETPVTVMNQSTKRANNFRTARTNIGRVRGPKLLPTRVTGLPFPGTDPGRAMGSHPVQLPLAPIERTSRESTSKPDKTSKERISKAEQASKVSHRDPTSKEKASQHDVTAKERVSSRRPGQTVPGSRKEATAPKPPEVSFKEAKTVRIFDGGPKPEVSRKPSATVSNDVTS